MTINQKIVQAMKEHDVSYPELSQKTGIALSSLHGYASGRSKRVPLSVIEKISKALDLHIDYWMDAEPISPIQTQGGHVEKASREYIEALERLSESAPEQLPVRNFMAELLELVNLYEKGLLTEEEFAAGKKFIMKMTIEE